MTTGNILSTLQPLLQEIRIPYSPSEDNTITLILLSCFFISCLALVKSRRFLVELGSNMFNNKSHISAFSTSTDSEVNSLLLLILQTCTLIGTIGFIFIHAQYPSILAKYHSGIIIGTATLSVLIYIGVKWLFYSFVGWVFNEKEKTAIWIEYYSSIIYYLGLIMYPLLLIITYNNCPLNVLLYFIISLLIVIKALILYKWVKLFSTLTYGHVLLFLYFCALEIIPCVILYKSISDYINVLTSNI